MHPVHLEACTRSEVARYRFGHGPRYDEFAVESSLFVKNQTTIAWKHSETIGIDFEEREPIEVLQEALVKFGAPSPEALRAEIEVYPVLMACHIGKPPRKIAKASRLPVKELLRRALILGLCGPTHYNPNRAVIWTRNRLTRIVDLYLPGEFYASH